MRYLAFDIEAANGYQPSSVCSVGFAIANESFTEMEKFNIWINPKTKYNLDGTRKNVGINLHLDKSLLRHSPDFKAAYPQIKALLTDPDTIVVGHAVESDVIMLNAACKRYRLPSIDFQYICTQLLFRLYKGENNVRGLDKIADEIGVTFEPHYSDEDAFVTLKTLQFLLSKFNSLEEMLEKYAIRKGCNHNFERTPTVSLLGQIGRRQILRQAKGKIDAYLKTLHKAPKGILQGQCIALSRQIECGEFARVKSVLEAIYANGGEYTSRIGKCTMYLTAEPVGDTESNRRKYLERLQAEGKQIVPEDVSAFLQRVPAAGAAEPSSANGKRGVIRKKRKQKSAEGSGLQ
mgnify:FL=1